jgi:serine/threonine protein kinase
MGEVWKASQVYSNQLVAIKFVRPDLLKVPEFRTRFLNEAKTLARLEHDRIVPFYGVREENGRLALVLRFVDGESVARRIDRLGPMPLELAMMCARDVLPALGYAHENDVVHRDVKSHNILISVKDHKECFFLSDFGIAVAEFSGRETDVGTSVGTLHYMSPEQIEGSPDLDPHRGGHRSDIYSFGVVMFEMLSGQLPFGNRRTREDAHEEIVAMHCNAAVPRLKDMNPALGANLSAMEAVVHQCLAKLPEDRPQSCAQLLQMLEDAAASADAFSTWDQTQLELDRRDTLLKGRHPESGHHDAQRIKSERQHALRPEIEQKLEAERREAQRLEALEAERLVAEREKAHRLEVEQKLEAERREAQRLEALETERLVAEREKAHRLEVEQKLEAERQEAQRLEALETERLVAEREKAERLEVERKLEAQRQEAQRLQASEADGNRNARATHGPMPTPRRRKLVLLGIAATLVVGASYGVFRAITVPTKTDRVRPVSPAPPFDWQRVRYDDPRLKDCGDVAACAARKQQSDNLQAPRNWGAIRYDDPLLRDCMEYSNCTERSEQASSLTSKPVGYWRTVRSGDPLLKDCMKYALCVEAASRTIAPQSIPEDTFPGKAKLEHGVKSIYDLSPEKK